MPFMLSMILKTSMNARDNQANCYLGWAGYVVDPEIFILSLNSNFKFWFAKRTGLAIS